MNGITLYTGHNPHEPPDHVMQVADMVRSLSNKYVPVSLLDKIGINLQNSLKDFCHCCRKRAMAVNLRECSDPPSAWLQAPTNSQSTEWSDINEWHDTHQLEPTDDDHYGFGTDLYDKITARP